MSCGTCGLQASDTLQADTGVPAGAPTTTRPRCPHCKAFVASAGAPCHNPRCRPVSGGLPAPAPAATSSADMYRDLLRQPDDPIRALYTGSLVPEGGWDALAATMRQAVRDYRTARRDQAEAEAWALLLVAAARQKQPRQATRWLLRAETAAARCRRRHERDDDEPLPYFTHTDLVDIWAEVAAGEDQDERLVALVCRSPRLAVDFAHLAGYNILRYWKQTAALPDTDYIHRELPALDRLREAACRSPEYALDFAIRIEGPHDRTRAVCGAAGGRLARAYARHVDRRFSPPPAEAAFPPAGEPAA